MSEGLLGEEAYRLLLEKIYMEIYSIQGCVHFKEEGLAKVENSDKSVFEGVLYTYIKVQIVYNENKEININKEGRKKEGIKNSRTMKGVGGR